MFRKNILLLSMNLNTRVVISKEYEKTRRIGEVKKKKKTIVNIIFIMVKNIVSCSDIASKNFKLENKKKKNRKTQKY